MSFVRYKWPVPRELLLTGPRALDIAEYDERPPGPGEARASAIASGISHGTELQLWRGTSAFHEQRFDPELRLFVPAEAGAAYPLRLGYEWVGRIAEVGAGVEAVREDDLVHLPRPHAETHVFAIDEPAGLPFRLPDGLAAERGTLLQTATIAVQAVHDASLKLGDRVAVFGLGVFGLLAVQLARLAGAEWIAAVDPVAGRRELGLRLGADVVYDPTSTDVGLELRRLDRVGADVAIEFSGTYPALQQALRSVRVAGTVVAAGFYPGGELALGQEFHHNRLTLVASMGGWGSPPREPRWPRSRARGLAASLLADGRLHVDDLITHRFPFGRAADAYELIDAQPDDVLRVLLDYSAG
jgi:2-desacetyl-2-hydroxyethyl bacteriochlorophyllide A dehydrogenase